MADQSTPTIQQKGGLVGIGASNPVSRLQVQDGDIRLQTSGSSPSIIFGSFGISTTYPQGKITLSDGGVYGGNLDFYTKDNGSSTNPLNLVMSITYNSRVGIGTASPSYKLDVAGMTRSTGNLITGGVLDIYGDSTPSSVNDKFAIGVSGTSYAWIQSFGGRQLRINDLGNNVVFSNATTRVGIGTTSPSALLDIQGTAESLYLLRVPGASPHIRMRGANGTVAALTTSASGNRVGQVSFEPYVSSGSFLEMTGIFGVVNGTVTSTAAPTDLVFAAGSSGAIASNERIRITSGGNTQFRFRNVSDEIMDLVVSTETANPSKSKIYLNWYGNETASIKFRRGGDSTGGELEFWTQPEGGSISQRMNINSVGNVGINTSSPSNRLHVVSSTAISSQVILRLDGGSAGFSGANDANTGFSIMFDGCSYKGSTGIVQRNGAEIQMLKDGSWNEAAGGSGTKGNLVFKTNNGTIDSPALAERMRITPAGNVGINSTGPSYRLEINSAGSENTLGLTSNNGVKIDMVGYGTGFTYPQARIQLTDAGFYGGILSFHTKDNGAQTNGLNQRMTILQNGRVGIGTASPAQLFEVRGGTAGADIARFTDSNYADLVIGFPTAGIASIDFEYGAAGTLLFRSGTGRIERMRIDSSGKITQSLSTGAAAIGNGINIFTQPGTYTSGHGGILQFQNEDVITAGIRGVRTTGWGSAMLFYVHNESAGNTLGSTFVERMRITETGEIWMGYTTDQGSYLLQVNGSVYASAYYESSDIRLKTILNRHESTNFDAIEYNWNDGRDNKLHWGYAAQEVMKILPDAVSGGGDKFYTLDYNQVHTYKIAMLEKEIAELKKQLKQK